jgi:hypothetical protein
MSKDNDPVNLGQIDIRQRCEDMAKKYLPQVDDAVNLLLATDPYKGILAWERIAEFAVAKKSKEALLPSNTNIVINLQPAKAEDATYIDITGQKEIGEEIPYDDSEL